MTVGERADVDLNGREQVGRDGDECDEGFGEAQFVDHDAVERAVDRDEGHGDGGMEEAKLEAFDEHGADCMEGGRRVNVDFVELYGMRMKII